MIRTEAKDSEITCLRGAFRLFGGLVVLVLPCGCCGGLTSDDHPFPGPMLNPLPILIRIFALLFCASVPSSIAYAQLLEVIDFDSPLPPGVTVSTTGIAHITSACSYPVSQGNHVYFGFDDSCDFDDPGYGVEGQLRIEGLALSPFASEIRFGLHRDDEGGDFCDAGGGIPWDALGLTIGASGQGQTCYPTGSGVSGVGFSGEYIANVEAYAGHTVYINAYFHSYDEFYNDSYGTSFDTFEVWGSDCNSNGVHDSEDIASGIALDCDGDGFLDACAIADQPSLDSNGNGILDTCEASGPYWFWSPVTHRLNTVLPQTSWRDAASQATGLAGTLLTIRSGAENEWIKGIIPGGEFWIGYHDSVVEGAFEWQSSELPGYENWSPTAPGSAFPDQDFVALRPADGTWDTWQSTTHWRAVVESNDIDCDGNLVLDKTQIQNDPSIDCDGNGQIDSCEVSAQPDLDCNNNGVLDLCEVFAPGHDCDANGLVDSCEIALDSNLDCNTNGMLDLCEVIDPPFDMNGDGLFDSCVPPTYCIGAPNSAGTGGLITAAGSPILLVSSLILHATNLPPSQWSYFLMSQSQASVPNFGGSQGTLCLGAPIVRLNTPGTGQASQTTAGGTRTHLLDFSNLPQGIVLQPGDTWNFQLWFRDVNPGATSNTTNGVTVMFR